MIAEVEGLDKRGMKSESGRGVSPLQQSRDGSATPGWDFLAAAALMAGVLAGASCLFGNNKTGN